MTGLTTGGQTTIARSQASKMKMNQASGVEPGLVLYKALVPYIYAN